MRKLILFLLLVTLIGCKKDAPAVIQTTIIYEMELYDAVSQKPAQVTATDAYVTLIFKAKDGSMKTITELGIKCNKMASTEFFDNANGTSISMEIKSNFSNSGKLFNSKITRVSSTGEVKVLASNSSTSGYVLTAIIN